MFLYLNDKDDISLITYSLHGFFV